MTSFYSRVNDARHLVVNFHKIYSLVHHLKCGNSWWCPTHSFNFHMVENKGVTTSHQQNYLNFGLTKPIIFVKIPYKLTIVCMRVCHLKQRGSYSLNTYTYTRTHTHTHTLTNLIIVANSNTMGMKCVTTFTPKNSII